MKEVISKDLIIIGTGGVGRETALIVEEINYVNKEWNLLGFVDDNKSIIGNEINGYEVLGDRTFLESYDQEVYVVCAIANHSIKEEIISFISNNKNIKFATLIHPQVRLNNTIEVGEGCIIYAGAILTVNIKVGNHVIISPKCGIGHDSIIEDYVTLLWNVNVSGAVRIGAGATLGSGSTIIQGLEIGRNSYIGAGAVIIRNIEENRTAVGVPSRYIGE